MAFILRIVQFLFLFCVLMGLLYLVVFVVSRVIQEVAKGMGYEVGNFLGWIKSLLPSLPKKK